MGQKIEIENASKGVLRELSGSKKTIGFFDPQALTIYLDASLPSDQRRRVFLHELLHASLGLSGMQNLLTDRQQEALCDLVENWQSLFEEKIDQLTGSSID